MFCVPTAAIGIGDIPYQAFMLGKLNMRSSHCNYCTCPPAMFGKEDNCTFQILSQNDLIETSTKKLKHVEDLAAGLKVGKFVGFPGITNLSYSRIPIQMWMSPGLHMGLGQLCDQTNRFQRFIMERLFNYE